jgi:hypothetical protein
VGGEDVKRSRMKICCNKSNDMPADFDSLRGTGDEIQFSNVGTERTPASGNYDYSYNTTLPVRTEASAPALCSLILDFIRFRADRLLRGSEMLHSSVGRYGKITARHS